MSEVGRRKLAGDIRLIERSALSGAGFGMDDFHAFIDKVKRVWEKVLNSLPDFIRKGLGSVKPVEDKLVESVKNAERNLVGGLNSVKSAIGPTASQALHSGSIDTRMDAVMDAKQAADLQTAYANMRTMSDDHQVIVSDYRVQMDEAHKKMNKLTRCIDKYDQSINSQNAVVEMYKGHADNARAHLDQHKQVMTRLQGDLARAQAEAKHNENRVRAVATAVREYMGFQPHASLGPSGGMKKNCCKECGTNCKLCKKCHLCENCKNGKCTACAN